VYGVSLPSLVAGLLASVCVLFQLWLPLAAILFGLPLMLVLISEPLKGLVMWLLLSPTVGSYMKLSLPAGVPDITFDRVVIGCVVLALMLQVVFRTRRLFPSGRIERAMLLFIIMGVLDVVLRSSRKGEEFLIFFDEYGIPFLFFVAAKNLFRSVDDIRTLIRVLFLVGLYLAFHGMYQFLTHGNLVTADAGGAEMLGHLVEGRAVGPFLNAGVYGTILVFAFVWTLYLVRFEDWRLAKSFFIVGLGVIGLGVFLSLTRAVWVGFLVSLFIVQVFDRKWRKPFALCLGGLILFSAAAWFARSAASLVHERLVAEDTVYQRLGSYRVALFMFLAKPVLGYGKDEGHFSTIRAEYLSKLGYTRAELVADMGPPHNQYLNTLVQYGLVGLLLYGALVFLMAESAATVMRMFPHPDSAEHQFAVLFYGMLGTYLVQGMFADVGAYTILGPLLYIFAGVLDGVRLRTHFVAGVSTGEVRMSRSKSASRAGDFNFGGE